MKRILLLVITGFVVFHGDAQVEIPEAQAMFIYNFSRLTEWPAEYKTGPFVIGVLGNGTIIKELEEYTQGKRVGAQSIVIKQYKDVGDIGRCHMLFVPCFKTKSLAEIKNAVASHSTLIISEKRGALEDGAAINFLVVEDRLKYEFSAANSKRAGIKYSTKLSEMSYKSL